MSAEIHEKLYILRQNVQTQSIENMVLLCPSHHVAVHRCNAPFDYGELAFVFTNHGEPLRYNAHWLRSA